MRRHRRRLRDDRRGTELLQAKGFPYALRDLLHDPALVDTYRDGPTSRCGSRRACTTASTRPHDGTVEHVTYISGDTWNVNPIALERVAEAVLQERARRDPHAARPVPVIS